MQKIVFVDTYLDDGVAHVEGTEAEMPVEDAEWFIQNGYAKLAETKPRKSLIEIASDRKRQQTEARKKREAETAKRKPVIDQWRATEIEPGPSTKKARSSWATKSAGKICLLAAVIRDAGFSTCVARMVDQFRNDPDDEASIASLDANGNLVDSTSMGIGWELLLNAIEGKSESEIQESIDGLGTDVEWWSIFGVRLPRGFFDARFASNEGSDSNKHVRTVKTPSLKFNGTPETGETFIHDELFRCVNWKQQYTFTTNQSKCFEVLFEAWKSGAPAVGMKDILYRAEISQERLDKVFQNKVKRKICTHPAWGTLVVKVEGTKDLFQLNLPKGTSISSSSPVKSPTKSPMK